MDRKKLFDLGKDLIEELFTTLLFFFIGLIAPMGRKRVKAVFDGWPFVTDQCIELLFLLIVPPALDQSPISDQHLGPNDLQFEFLKLIDGRAVDVIDLPIDGAAFIKRIIGEIKNQENEEYKDPESGKDLPPYGKTKGQRWGDQRLRCLMIFFLRSL